MDSSFNNNIPTTVDIATLTLLTNPISRARIESLLINKNDVKQRHKELRHEVKFYRKRIFQALRELLIGKDIPEYIRKQTKDSWEILITSLINDFKTLDTKDIVQADFAETADISLSQNINIISASDSERAIELANQQIMNTRTIPVTLDKYVIRKKTEQPYPWCARQTIVDEPQVKVDLKDKKLRTKGLKPKQKIEQQSIPMENLTTTYEKEDDAEKKDKTSEKRGFQSCNQKQKSQQKSGKKSGKKSSRSGKTNEEVTGL